MFNLTKIWRNFSKWLCWCTLPPAGYKHFCCPLSSLTLDIMKLIVSYQFGKCKMLAHDVNHALLWWLMRLSVFSYVYWPFMFVVLWVPFDRFLHFSIERSSFTYWYVRVQNAFWIPNFCLSCVLYISPVSEPCISNQCRLLKDQDKLLT